MSGLRPFDPYRGAEPLGEMWRMAKGPRTAIVRLATHQMGWELKATVDGDLVSSEVCKEDARVFQVADAWRAAFMEKGWIASTA